SDLFDVDRALDLLAAQIQPPGRRPLSYRAYMATFEADVATFYRPEGPVSPWERLRSAWRGYWHPRERRPQTNFGVPSWRDVGRVACVTGNSALTCRLAAGLPSVRGFRGFPVIVFGLAKAG